MKKYKRKSEIAETIKRNVFFLILTIVFATTMVTMVVVTGKKGEYTRPNGKFATANLEKISLLQKMLNTGAEVANVFEGIRQTVSSVADLWKGEDEKEVSFDWNAWAVGNGYGPCFHEVDADYGDFIRQELKAINSRITWQTVVSKICIESANNSDLVGSAGEIGLMQIKPITGQEMGVSNPNNLYDPKTNIRAGIKYLDGLEKSLGSSAAALVGYHYGLSGAKKRFNSLDKPLDLYVDNLKVAGVLKAAGI